MASLRSMCVGSRPLRSSAAVSLALIALVLSPRPAAAAPGDPIWSLATGQQNVGSSPAIASDGTIYVGGADGTLFALRYQAGVASVVWRFTAGGPIGSTPLVAPDGTIYFGCFDGKLYSLSADGKQRWAFATGGAIYSSPARAVDGTLYVGSSDTRVYAVSSAGAQVWQATTGGEVGSSPAVDSSGNVYVGSADGSLRSFTPTGTLRWSYATGQGVVSPAVGIGGRVYAGSFDGHVYALNPSDGTLQWSFDALGRVAGAPATALDGTVYVTGYDSGKLTALSYSGTVLWSYPPTSSGSVYSSPAVAADGSVVFGAYGGLLRSVRANGQLKWSVSTGSDWLGSPTIAADGTVVAGTFDGTVRGIADDSTGPMASVWPMFGRSAVHERRSLDADSDGDGILNSWEQLYAAAGLNPNAIGDALLDPDRDTLTNLEESNRGLSPLQPNDPVSGAPLTITLGDVAPLGATDGQVNVADVLVLERVVTTPGLFDSLAPGTRVILTLAGDLNHDGSLDSADVLLLTRQVTSGAP